MALHFPPQWSVFKSQMIPNGIILLMLIAILLLSKAIDNIKKNFNILSTAIDDKTQFTFWCLPEILTILKGNTSCTFSKMQFAYCRENIQNVVDDEERLDVRGDLFYPKEPLLLKEIFKLAIIDFKKQCHGFDGYRLGAFSMKDSQENDARILIFTLSILDNKRSNTEEMKRFVFFFYEDQNKSNGLNDLEKDLNF